VDVYRAPVDRIVRAMRAVGLDDVLAMPAYSAIDAVALAEVLGGFAKLAEEVITPSDRVGDRRPPVLNLETATVTVPDEVAAAMASYVEGGWIGLSVSGTHGGGGFPAIAGLAVHEMFGSANLGVSLGPMLTQSTIELLEQIGDERLQRVVLRRLINGTWSGTMQLTEPDAGSDLNAVRSIAEPIGDGRYAISGTKIYITWGENPLVENTVHLVLARTPGAAPGVKGISLFLVPKFMFDDDGNLGERNTVWCRALEHKLGIHASPTCVMEFDGAVGELVGPLHGGMDAMFIMMNLARLAVGVQGVSVAERAMQQAIAYAEARVQGRGVGADRSGDVAIIDHPDIRRMLADMAVTVDASRLLTFANSIAIDRAAHHPDADERARSQRRADLLTPLSKAWGTDQGVRVASLALQVHGGMGFIEETGIAQRYRDVRIAPIYEGANGIQAIDLVGRKVVRDGGAALAELLDEVRTVCAVGATLPALAAGATAVAALADEARVVGEWVIANHPTDPRTTLLGATKFLELLSVVAAGGLLVQWGVAEADQPTAGQLASSLAFFAQEHVARAPRLAEISIGMGVVDGVLSQK